MSDLPTVGSQQQLSLEDVSRELVRKRKALDKEIEKFMALKDAEFKQFEKELCSQVARDQVETVSPATRTSPTIVSRGFSVASTFPSLAPKPKENDPEKVDGPTATGSTENNTALTRKPSKWLSLSEHPKDDEQELGALNLDMKENSVALDHRNDLTTFAKPRLSTSLTTSSHLSNRERPDLLDRRLSTSPISTGRSSRKSSLKRPVSSDSATAITRGRKQVLFSIDNQVIAPTATPIVSQPISTRNPSIPFSGSRDFETNDMLLLNRGDIAAPSSLVTSPLSYSRSYKDLIQPTVTTPPEELAQEELQLGNKDPMFETDEAPLDEIGWDSPVETRSEDEAETLSTSPHVGSLPIQIRFPGRR